MKKIVLPGILIVILTGLIFQGCKKTDDKPSGNDPQTPSGTPYLSRYTIADSAGVQENDVYHYDDSNRLTEILYYEGEDYHYPVAKRTFQYGGGKLLRSEYSQPGSSQDYISNYEYNSNGKIAVCFYNIMYPNPDLNIYLKFVFKYDSSGGASLLLKKDSYVQADSSYMYESHAYTYDARGNPTKILSYNSDGRLSGSAEYEYDDKINPLQRSDPERAASQPYVNNLIKDGPGQPEDSYVYRYNAQGYPLSCTHGKQTLIYEYTYR
jgi:hypothetical protein